MRELSNRECTLRRCGYVQTLVTIFLYNLLSFNSVIAKGLDLWIIFSYYYLATRWDKAWISFKYLSSFSTRITIEFYQKAERNVVFLIFQTKKTFKKNCGKSIYIYEFFRCIWSRFSDKFPATNLRVHFKTKASITRVWESIRQQTPLKQIACNICHIHFEVIARSSTKMNPM